MVLKLLVQDAHNEAERPPPRREYVVDEVHVTPCLLDSVVDAFLQKSDAREFRLIAEPVDVREEGEEDVDVFAGDAIELANARAALQHAVEGGQGSCMPKGRVSAVRVTEENHEVANEDEGLDRKAPGNLMTEEFSHCYGASR